MIASSSFIQLILRARHLDYQGNGLLGTVIYLLV